jgi:hypothetical protein
MDEFLKNLTTAQKKKVEDYLEDGLTIESIADGVVIMVGGPENRIMIMPSGKKKKFR